MPADNLEHHSDHPTLNDKLNRTESIKKKARIITQCNPPQVFGIHGDWGAGKTSYLHQLRYHLDGQTTGYSDAATDLEEKAYENEVMTIWFDAWRYQHEKNPIIALLHEIRRQFSTWANLKASTLKLTAVTIRTVLNSFTDVAKLLSFEAVPISAKGIEQLGEKWEKEHLENKLGSDTVQDFLEQAIDSILESGVALPDNKKRKLVIIIDDLDRCSPNSAYRLLESLKVYLNLKNCVFVIGMNQQIIIEAIAQQLTLNGEIAANLSHPTPINIRAEAYLEKMCNSIERLHPYHKCNDLLGSWINNTHFRQLLVTALIDDQGHSLSCLPPNPRRLKALANLLNEWAPLIGLTDEGRTGDTKIRKAQSLVILAYVYQFHGELFQRWQFTPSFYNNLVDWIGSYEYKNTKKWPIYLTSLELPNYALKGDEGDAVPEVSFKSNYPDPYSANVFWIAPLIRYAELSESEISPILEVISTGRNN